MQLNYDFLHQCVSRAPVTPMPSEAWDSILNKLSPRLLSSPLSAPLLPTLHNEVHSSYEDTIRKTNIKMTLVKPTVNGLLPDPPLPTEELSVLTKLAISVKLNPIFLCRGLDFSTPWKERYEFASAMLESTLHVNHPIMRALLQLWDKYRDTLLLDLSSVRYWSNSLGLHQ